MWSSGKSQGLGYSIIDGDSLALSRRRENNILTDLLIADQGQTLSVEKSWADLDLIPYWTSVSVPAFISC